MVRRCLPCLMSLSTRLRWTRRAFIMPPQAQDGGHHLKEHGHLQGPLALNLYQAAEVRDGEKEEFGRRQPGL